MTIYAADFEATVETMLVNGESSPRVVVTWAGLQSCDTMKQQTFQTRYKGRVFIDALESFMNTVKRLNDGSIVCFHNLEGYDHAFIYDWAWRNNYKIQGQPNDFYINFGNSKSKRAIRFFDTLNLLAGSIAQLAETVGLAKGGKDKITTPLVAKFDKKSVTERIETTSPEGRFIFDYVTIDQPLEKTFKLKQWDIYACEDINILSHVINKFNIEKLLHNKINTKANWAWQSLWNANYEEADPGYNWLSELSEPGLSQKRFAKNDLTAAINKLIIKAYKGGLTFVNTKYRGPEILRPGRTFDINSMYPSIYRYQPLPKALCSKLIRITSKDDLFNTLFNHEREELYFIRFKDLVADLKPDKTMPLIKNRTDTDSTGDYKGFDENSHEYLPHYESKSTVLTGVEVDYLFDSYDFSFTNCEVYIHEYDYQLMDRFRKHCDYWYNIKQTATDKASQFMAKLMLNSAYGKAAQYTKDLSNKRFKYVDGCLVQEGYKTQGGYEFANVAAGAYITAYGRVWLAKLINAIGPDHFVYCDTDSLHVFDGLDYNSIFEIDSSKLGAFKEEVVFTKGRWLAPKTYAEYGYESKQPEKVSWLVHTAGSATVFNVENFVAGQQIEVKRRVYAPGGCYLAVREFTLAASKTAKINNNRLLASIERNKQIIASRAQ